MKHVWNQLLRGFLAQFDGYRSAAPCGKLQEIASGYITHSPTPKGIVPKRSEIPKSFFPSVFLINQNEPTLDELIFMIFPHRSSVKRLIPY
jgi:hypothetical protein